MRGGGVSAAPSVAAHGECLDPAEGDGETLQAESLLDVDEQEMLLTARRGRQGLMTGPVQFGEAQGLVQPDQGLPRFGSREQRDSVHVPLRGEGASLEGVGDEGVPHSQGSGRR